MKQLILLAGPPGSGKSTLARQYEKDGFTRINQDAQGADHLDIFDNAMFDGKNIIVDRMGHSKAQRSRYLDLCKIHGYKTKIIVLHEPYDTCLSRMINRKDHETIKDEVHAKKALHFFFTRYERVEDNEADEVERRWSQIERPSAVVIDLDGTLCDASHRIHFVRPPPIQVPGTTNAVELIEKSKFKKNWKAFFEGLKDDPPNQWCIDLAYCMSSIHNIVFCSGRGQEYEHPTRSWLAQYLPFENYDLFMRQPGDHRQDFVIKEIILDFEILTRFKPILFVDDRKQVVDLWRRRGFICLACDDGEF